MLVAPSNLAGLEAAADKELQTVLTHGGLLTPPPKGEVGAVASVTLDGVAAIAGAWRALLPSVHMTLLGVFCHSSPQVDITYPHGPSNERELDQELPAGPVRRRHLDAPVHRTREAVSLEPAYIGLERRPAPGRHDHVADRLPKRVVLGSAEQPYRGRVSTCDDALTIRDEHGVEHRFQDGMEVVRHDPPVCRVSHRLTLTV